MEEYLGPDGWLIAGRHEVDLADLESAFAPPEDRRRTEIWRAIQILHSVCVELWAGGVLLIAGQFVSSRPGTPDRPTIAIVPDNPNDAADWSDAQDERLTGFLSLHDVIVGALGPTYLPVLHPLSGCLEVLYCEPQDATWVASMMGAVTLADGSDRLGEHGVLEVAF